MPVFVKNNLKVLYVHIPKTGGTYIEDLFRQNGFDVKFWESNLLGGALRCSPQHYHYELLNNIFDLNEFNYVFATIRHPLDRFFSEFNMRNEAHGGKLDINKWTINVLTTHYSNNPFFLDNHIRPQNEFVDESIPKFKQEDRFDESFAEEIAKNLRIDFQVKSVPSRRATSSQIHKANSSQLEEQVLEKVKEFYRDDFEFYSSMK